MTKNHRRNGCRLALIQTLGQDSGFTLSPGTSLPFRGTLLLLLALGFLFSGTKSMAATIALAPTSASLEISQQLSFKVTGAAGVVWTISPAVGSISSSGVYTAPSSIPAAQNVTVTATSIWDNSSTASAVISLEPVAVSMTPASSSLSPGQNLVLTTTVSATSNTGLTWSLIPATGSLTPNGTGAVYTPPPSVSRAQAVIISATSTADPTKSASTVVKLIPINVSVTPATSMITSPQTQLLTASISPASGVTWSLSPAMGSLSTAGTSAVYSSPASMSGPQNITVTATSVSDPTRSASSSIFVTPSKISVTIGPHGSALSNGQTVQLSATVMNTANTAVSWSLSAAIGVISSAGLYTAPALIASAQTVTVTATSVADPTKSASTTLSLVPDVVPPVITLTSPASGATVSGSIVVTATASDNVGVTNVQFSVDGTSVGSSASAPYSATWNTASLPNGSHQVTATASDAAGNTASQSATVTVSNPVTSVTLPVEVVGPNGTTKAVTVNIAAPVSGAQLWMQIHNLKYETEASVQINGGAWIPINTSTVTLQGLAAAYGGIGGGFSTLKLTLPIPNGSLVAGANTVAFRFNGTDGVSSGFRVLQFNFLDSNGNQLVAANSFVQDDPNTWQAPSTLPADIAAGKCYGRRRDSRHQSEVHKFRSRRRAECVIPRTDAI